MSVSNTIRIFGENIPVEDMNENVLAKLKILAESAKYDVSCSSSGTVRRNSTGTLGNTVGGWGICHSFAEDGRCISLLKIMLTNYCIYDCAYCINRRSNDIPRATLSVSELVDLTIELPIYNRNRTARITIITPISKLCLFSFNWMETILTSFFIM